MRFRSIIRLDLWADGDDYMPVSFPVTPVAAEALAIQPSLPVSRAMKKNVSNRGDQAIRPAKCADSNANKLCTGASPEPGRSRVVHLQSRTVLSAFDQGMPLIENSVFKIHAGRRVKPGQAESHADETDIFYIIQGEATLVTGGTIINGKEIEPNEVRGDGITGGTTVTLQTGDIIIVPPGTPHWFKQIKAGPFLYYTVKSIEQ